MMTSLREISSFLYKIWNVFDTAEPLTIQAGKTIGPFCPGIAALVVVFVFELSLPEVSLENLL